MADTLRIGFLTFTARPVSARMADSVLRDPVPAAGIWRSVWSWDGTAGKPLVAMTEGGAVPLGNALVFQRPRAMAGGAVVPDAKAARKMSDRFCEEVGAPDLETVVNAMVQIVHSPQKTVPFDIYRPLQPVAAFTIRQHTDYAVVELVNEDRALSAYLCLPNRVSYHHEITRILDQDGFEALMDAQPGLRAPQPSYAVPGRSVANCRLRLRALRQRDREIAAQRAKVPPGAAGEVALANLAGRERRLREEVALLTKAPEGIQANMK